MTTVHATPESRNHEWGFYGSLAIEEDNRRALVFAIARDYIASTFDVSATVARDYLDSTSGRHFADSLTYQTDHAAIETVAQVAAAAPGWIASDFRKWRKTYNAAEFARSLEG